MNTRTEGKDYEALAKSYLMNQGYQIIEMNYRCKMGEVDIVGKDGNYLCFIEVKYRKTNAKGSPYEAVNYKKQHKICRTADYYLMSHRLFEDTSVRFDVVSILGDEVTLYKNAFSYISC